MLFLSKRPSPLLFVLALVTAAGVCGCSSSTALTGEKLDPLTSATISYSEQPLVFYRDVSGRAALAKDFVYVAPVAVNRGGNYRYFIWLGIWTVAGEASTDAMRDGFESILLVADGAPLQLAVTGWTVDAIGASEPVYSKPVASAADAYYEVTLDQLRPLAEALHLRLLIGGNALDMFEPWDDQRRGKAALLEFIDGPAY
jgi:hypothetical protein